MSVVDLRVLEGCFEGVVPAVVATAGRDGIPNVTYLSRVRLVDRERIALSNQFFSKTVRNLAENPRASVLLVDPATYDEYRLTLVYERTERRGAVFDQLRADVELVAAIHNMQDVFKLRAADIYRVLDVERLRSHVPRAGAAPDRSPTAGTDQLAEFTACLARLTDLDTIVSSTVNGLADLLGFEHSLLLLVDERGDRLYTIASHGYPDEGIGSEVVIGEGIIGMAATRAAPIRLGGLRQMAKYGRAVRRAFEDHGAIEPGREIPVPGLADAESRIAAPAIALGQLVGVLTVESREKVAFTEADEMLLSIVAALVANAIEIEHARERTETPAAASVRTAPRNPDPAIPTTHVRFFAVDGSTFLDGDYLIKGVAGRILWSLLDAHARDGRVDFTNKEVRLDPSLELPEFRDNLDSRLLLLKRRLDERAAPVRIEKTGRGRFRLIVDRPVRLDRVGGDV